VSVMAITVGCDEKSVARRSMVGEDSPHAVGTLPLKPKPGLNGAPAC